MRAVEQMKTVIYVTIMLATWGHLSGQVQSPPQERLQLVSVSGLIDAYDRNELMADQAFKEKWFIVTGVVHEVRKEGDSYYLRLCSSKEQEFRCYFKGEAVGALAKLSPDQSVQILGQCKGRKVIGRFTFRDRDIFLISMVNCRVFRIGPFDYESVSILQGDPNYFHATNRPCSRHIGGVVLGHIQRGQAIRRGFRACPSCKP